MSIGRRHIKKNGEADEMTRMTLMTLNTVERYPINVATSCSSTVYMSLENRLTILPIGVVSKKAIGALRTVSKRREKNLSYVAE